MNNEIYTVKKSIESLMPNVKYKFKLYDENTDIIDIKVRGEHTYNFNMIIEDDTTPQEAFEYQASNLEDILHYNLDDDSIGVKVEVLKDSVEINNDFYTGIFRVTLN